MEIKIIDNVFCPKCKAPELHVNGAMVHIRINKVCINKQWYSRCLVCSGGFDKIDGNYSEKHDDQNQGWFKT